MLVACSGSAHEPSAPRAVQAPRDPAWIPNVGDTPPPDPFGATGRTPEAHGCCWAPPPPPACCLAPALTWEDFREPAGDVAGMPGFTIEHKASKKHCGGIAIIVKRSRKVAVDDAPLAAVFALEFPKGMSFDMRDAGKQKSSKRKFEAFIKRLTTVTAAALAHYKPQLDATDPAVKVAAAARIAQVTTRAASLIARAEIPLDVRTGELVTDKIDAYCRALLAAAEPLQANAAAALGACVEHAKTADGGWWNELCVVP